MVHKVFVSSTVALFMLTVFWPTIKHAVAQNLVAAGGPVPPAQPAPPPATSPSDRKLLVIMLDGFRWDYFKKFDDKELTGFYRLRCQGASAGEILPVFPSLSFVNYYSLMTGLYAESHGMVDNYMYDDVHGTEFLIGENEDEVFPYWWDDGEPLWVTAKKQNKNSYFWYWCGCEIEIRGYRPNFCQPYLSSPNPSFQNFSDALDQAVKVLQNGSADIAGVYLEAVDDSGHHGGPNGLPLLDIIRNVDKQLAKVQDQLETKRFPDQTTGSMFDRVNLAVFSDHGMTERRGGANDNRTAVIRLFDYVEPTDYIRAMGSTVGPILSIWPLVGKEEWLYNILKNAHPNLTVYRKTDIPAKYHIKNHYRIPYIYCVADPGFVIIRSRSTVVSNIGYHGYDPVLRDMHGIFLARGPDFKKNFALQSLPNVDLYAMFCGLLGITPSPNNGSLYPVCEMLAAPTACGKQVHINKDDVIQKDELNKDDVINQNEIYKEDVIVQDDVQKDDVAEQAELHKDDVIMQEAGGIRHDHKHVDNYAQLLQMLLEKRKQEYLARKAQQDAASELEAGMNPSERSGFLDDSLLGKRYRGGILQEDGYQEPRGYREEIIREPTERKYVDAVREEKYRNLLDLIGNWKGRDLKGTGEPGRDWKGTGEPGRDWKGTGEPGRDWKGTGEPGRNWKGTGEPGRDWKGTGEPGRDWKGTGEPGKDWKGTGEPGRDWKGTGEPGRNWKGTGEPGA